MAVWLTRLKRGSAARNKLILAFAAIVKQLTCLTGKVWPLDLGEMGSQRRSAVLATYKNAVYTSVGDSYPTILVMTLNKLTLLALVPLVLAVPQVSQTSCRPSFVAHSYSFVISEALVPLEGLERPLLVQLAMPRPPRHQRL